MNNTVETLVELFDQTMIMQSYDCYEDLEMMLLGCCVNRGIDIEKAYRFPYMLEARLDKPAYNSSYDEIYNAITMQPMLHRYTKDSAKTVVSFYEKVKEYDGDIRNMWKDKPTAVTLVKRFKTIYGVGDKIANMITRILTTGENCTSDGLSSIDISADVHVIRVFNRTGLSNSNKPKDIIQTARKLYPNAPVKLDSAWYIGINYCDPKRPICSECPLITSCQRNGV